MREEQKPRLWEPGESRPEGIQCGEGTLVRKKLVPWGSKALVLGGNQFFGGGEVLWLFVWL